MLSFRYSQESALAGVYPYCVLVAYLSHSVFHDNTRIRSFSDPTSSWTMMGRRGFGGIGTVDEVSLQLAITIRRVDISYLGPVPLNERLRP